MIKYIIRLWRNFRYGVQNLIRFYKVVWQFRWWDHSYMTAIILKTFEEFYNGFKLETRHADIAQDLKALKLLIKLIKSYYQYTQQPTDTVYSKFPTEFEIHIGKESLEFRKAWRLAMCREVARENKRRKLIADLLKKYYFRWWV